MRAKAAIPFFGRDPKSVSSMGVYYTKSSSRALVDSKVVALAHANWKLLMGNETWLEDTRQDAW